jgi:hypothetical protein
MNRLGHGELKLFYADQERFYVPEFNIARCEFERNSMNCRVLGEMATKEGDVEDGLFLDLPFLYHRVGLYQKIVPAYRDGRVKFVIPPKPFFGAKGVLALLRNDGADQQLEAVLLSFIDKEALELVRKYIPETWLVGKQLQGSSAMEDRISAKRYVLKESISSGMKGVFFSDEPDFTSALKIANGQKMNWILQEEVQNQPQTFSYFDEGFPEPVSVLGTSSDWFMRVTVHYVARQLADVVVTATQSRAVHGGKRCLQLGTIVV